MRGTDAKFQEFAASISIHYGEYGTVHGFESIACHRKPTDRRMALVLVERMGGEMSSTIILKVITLDPPLYLYKGLVPAVDQS